MTDVAEPPVLQVQDLHVRYGRLHVLQGVSFEVPATGVTALLGRNGVGKTTTLKAVLGLAPRTGSVLRADAPPVSRGKQGKGQHGRMRDRQTTLYQRATGESVPRAETSG